MEESPILPYPAHFIIALLSAMSWPRKTGLLGKKTVAGAALNGAWAGMAQAAMGLGAGRPLVACQLITKLFSRRDWTQGSGDELLAGLDPAKQIAPQAGDPPWEALVRKYLEVTPPRVPWDQLFTPDLVNVWTAQCAAGLIYGLAHAADVGRALDQDRARYTAEAPEAIRHGLNVPATPPFPDNEAFYRWAEQTVRSYEARTGQLQQPAPQLLMAAVVRERMVRERRI